MSKRIRCAIPGGYQIELGSKCRAMTMHPAGDDGWFISKQFNNGEFDYWVVAEVVDFLDATGELMDGYQYAVEVSVVAPSQIDENTMHGVELYQPDDPVCTAIDVAQYGIKAILCTCYGNSAAATLRYAKRIANAANLLFGFIMDAPQNRIGSSGWDFIRGNILGGLNLPRGESENGDD